MNEHPKDFGSLTNEEFDQLLERAAAPELHDMTPETFFTALAAIDEEAPPLELSATVKDGKLSFLEPAPLFVHANELRLGTQRVIINLVPESAAHA